MFLVIPVAQDHGELAVVLVVLSFWVENEGSTETVDILAVVVGMYPVCTPLTGCIDGNLIRERLVGRNAAADEVIEMNTGAAWRQDDKTTRYFLPLGHTCGTVIPRG